MTRTAIIQIGGVFYPEQTAKLWKFGDAVFLASFRQAL